MPSVSASFFDHSCGTRTHGAESHRQPHPGLATGSDGAGESAAKSDSPGPGGSGQNTRTPPGSEPNAWLRIPTATSLRSMEGAATPASARAARSSTSTNRPGMGASPIICGPRLGLTADLRGYYGTAFITPNPYNIFKPSISEYTFMAGPQYRFVRREHWAISGTGSGGWGQGQLQWKQCPGFPAR